MKKCGFPRIMINTVQFSMAYIFVYGNMYNYWFVIQNAKSGFFTFTQCLYLFLNS